MKMSDIALPEIYQQSSDFRILCKWFQTALSQIQYDTENMFDLYDALRCPADLLWMLGDTIGYKYDDRLPTAFNRLVILYFMSLIRNRGSKDGVTLAAEINLAQFVILQRGAESDILHNRLEDTSIPVNSVYVTPHTSDGYIDVVYFSTKLPTDACLEYVRPLGMYMFQHAGVRYEARTKLSVDARLTNSKDLGINIGATHVGHYSREDYARLQKMQDEPDQTVDTSHTRRDVWYRNSVAEGQADDDINPGYRALYSLQLANNEQVMKALIDPIFSIGFGPQDVTTTYPANYLNVSDNPLYNLRYNRALEEGLKDISLGAATPTTVTTPPTNAPDVYTVDSDRTTDVLHPSPAVNAIMHTLGDAMSSDT